MTCTRVSVMCSIEEEKKKPPGYILFDATLITSLIN